MKNILIFLLALIPFLLVNCRKGPREGTIIAMSVDIAYKDQSGNDLLDPSHSGYYSADNIHVFNVTNGVKTEVNYPNLDYPHDFMIYKNENLNSYYLRLFIDTDTTYLELNKTITDTVISTSQRSYGNWILTKVWYNGIVKWDSNGPMVFTILK